MSNHELQQHLDRLQLQEYARQELSGTNKAQAFINIVAKASDIINSRPITESASTEPISEPFSEMVELIEQVLIGESMFNDEGRSEGPYFVGLNSNYNGSSGFKPELRDDYFQVQHAAAGLIIGFKGGIGGEVLARALEAEPQDDALYSATAAVGQWLVAKSVDQADVPFQTPLFYDRGEALNIVPLLLLESICDNSCKLPSAEDLQIHTDDSNSDTVPDTSTQMSPPDFNERIGEDPFSNALYPFLGNAHDAAVSDSGYPTSQPTEGVNPAEALDQELYPTSQPAEGVNPAEALDQELYPTSQPTEGVNPAEALDQELYPTSQPAEGVNPAEALDQELYPTSQPAEGVNPAEALDQELYPTSQPESSVGSVSDSNEVGRMDYLDEVEEASEVGAMDYLDDFPTSPPESSIDQVSDSNEVGGMDYLDEVEVVNFGIELPSSPPGSVNFQQEVDYEQ
ncbi:hypothetical protein [Adhaeribacter radiodurans]|uniref:Uncharacterized protein n=1 Tax=Adhaeribacter radiodurans TaxID=2745197 RepID=A0A7L7L5R6_9BACT|nr:hypothetical protein [Adhaeribacter radiodurans]QMU28113.1 hypothetical protein HUW48_08665 [Adhaeribacter radiodurans]